MTAAEAILGRTGSLNREPEEVIGVMAGGVEQRLEQLLLVGPPLDVDVLRGPRPHGEAQVEREPSLQQPSPWCNSEKPSEQPVEGDALAVADKAGAVSVCSVLQPLLERLAEGGCVLIPHAETPSRLRSMNLRTRAERVDAAARSRRGVVRPRSRAWRTASSTCSG